MEKLMKSEKHGIKNSSPSNFELEKVLYNLNIAHEIAMNRNLKEIRMEDFLVKNELWNTVKDQIHSAFWDIFKSEITQNPPVLNMAFMLIKDIKESLFSVMTPNLSKLKTEVEEVLDISLLKQKAEHGVVNVLDCARYVTSVMREICAPARDENIARISNETDVVEIFRGILETLNLMKIDLINFALKSIAPDILTNQQEYERKKFREYLELVGGKLPDTETWLRKNQDANLAQNEILYRAFLEVFETKKLPETLFVDAPRLNILQREYYNLILCSSLVIISLNCVPPDLSTDPSYKKTLKNNISILINDISTDEALERNLPNLIEQIKKDSNIKLNEKGRPELSELTMKTIEQQIKEVISPENKIRSLITRRIKEYLKDSLHGSENEKFPVALLLFQNELEALNLKFKQIVYHNIKICGSYYSKILQV